MELFYKTVFSSSLDYETFLLNSIGLWLDDGTFLLNCFSCWIDDGTFYWIALAFE